MSEEKRISVIIVDDHQIFRDGLCALFIGNRKFEVIGEAFNGISLFELLKMKTPEIILLDISMPGMSGIEIIKILKADFSDIKVIILSANDDEQNITEAIKAGALGFLDKNCSQDELFFALNQIINNQNYFSDNISQIVFRKFVEKVNSDSQSQLDKLSQREIEIVKLIADGFMFKEIADKLFISPRTVEAHKNNILEKLQIKTTADLIKFAIKHNITTV